MFGDAEAFGLDVFDRPFGVRGYVPEQSLCGRDEQSVFGKVYREGKEAEE
jgi:hypothetical protein